MAVVATVALAAFVGATTATGSSGLPADWADWPMVPSTRASDYLFRDSEGRPMRWTRVAPAYAAWSIDQRSPGGPIVFAGVPFTMTGLFETQECESVGCHVYRFDPNGRVEQLFSQGGGYGLMGVGISTDGNQIAAVSIDTDPGASVRGRLLSWRDGELRTRNLAEQAFSIEDLRGSSFLATARDLVFTGGSPDWELWRTGAGCAFYDIDASGPRVLLAGYSGTYIDARPGIALRQAGSAPRSRKHRARRRHARHHRRRHRRQRHRRSRPAQGPASGTEPSDARRIGPAADAVWSARDGQTIVISPIAAGRELMMSRDAGRSWESQTLVDQVGDGACQNVAGNDAGACDDDVPGARLDIHAIAGGGTDDLWATGVRADIPGGRVYRYAGGDRWERIPFPADIWSASDIVVVERGRPLVASMDGIYRAEPL